MGNFSGAGVHNNARKIMEALQSTFSNDSQKSVVQYCSAFGSFDRAFSRRNDKLVVVFLYRGKERR